ncbi:MAG TPA: Asp-tRNA(Asn)/Glu-tRNA(Gln) amidotransferase subunit GatC [Erysipelothrix sp.]|nr:Asp-tRNA(Asn)/Glu-tRNA(Gln) amidotransferase subunit GatC [Erysipelothrix sp.]
MNKLSKEHIQKLANQLMFRLSDDEIKEIQVEFETLTKQLATLDKIDTTDVEPMIYPFEIVSTSLRDDEVVSELRLEDVLLNAPETQDNYFVVPKVVD